MSRSALAPHLVEYPAPGELAERYCLDGTGLVCRWERHDRVRRHRGRRLRGPASREARRLRDEQAQPFVVVQLQPSPVSGQLLELVVENIGRTIARDVRFHFSPRLESALERYELADSPLLTSGIPTMPPRRDGGRS